LPCGEKLRVLIRQETGWDPDRVWKPFEDKNSWPM
jgi:hypothetical protein